MARIVLHIHALSIGGAERIALQWAGWLADEGHEVWMLLGKQHESEFFEVPSGVHIASVPTSARTTVIWLRDWLISFRPNLVIGVTTRPAINLLLASVGQLWPVVVAERNYPPAKALPWFWSCLRSWLYPKAYLHLVQTERIGLWLTNHKLARSFSILPNPLIWPLPQQSPEVGPADVIPEGVPVLLSVGTKPYQKGFDRLIAAFVRLAEAYPRWQLVLLGVASDHPELLAALAHYPSEAAWRTRLFVPGAVGNLSVWYARASIFVLASRFEGFPNVLAEAMGSGCACVAVDCPTGPRELIIDEVNGLLVPFVEDTSHQTELLVRSLARLMDDTGLRERLSDHACGLKSLLSPLRIKQLFLETLEPALTPKVLIFAPTRRSPTETFIRANLEKLPMHKRVYFGDEYGLRARGIDVGQFAYGLSILLSKLLTRLHLYRLATLPGSLVAFCLIHLHRPSVILAEFGFHAVRMMDAALWTHVPLVVHFRGSDASADRRVVALRERYQHLMHFVTALIVKSQPMHHTLVSLGAPESAITISPSGANALLFAGASPADAEPVALFVGRFVEKKGPLDAISAFARARDQLMQTAANSDLAQQIRLLMVGDGPLHQPIVRRIHELQLNRQIVLLGLCPPEQIALLMRQSRCLLLPSRTATDGDAEGCPVVVQEAQVAGLPVVSTLHAGIPEVVCHRCTGLLADEGDVEALASFLVSLFVSPELATKMGKSAADHARNRFTIGAHVDTVHDVLVHAARYPRYDTMNQRS